MTRMLLQCLVPPPFVIKFLASLHSWGSNLIKIWVAGAVINHIIFFPDILIGSIIAIVIGEIHSDTVFHFKSSFGVVLRTPPHPKKQTLIRLVPCTFQVYNTREIRLSKIGQIEADFPHFFPYSETILERIFVDFQNISLKCTSISNQLG